MTETNLQTVNPNLAKKENFVENLLPRNESRIAELWSVAQAVALSGYFRDLDKQNARVAASQAMVKIMVGQDLGISPMASIKNVHVILDKGIAIGVHLMSALIRRSGAEFTIWQMDEFSCKIEFFADAQKEINVGNAEYTIEEAIRAGLANNPKRDVWQKYRDRMLYARAMSKGFNLYFSHLAMGGVHTPEELGYNVETGEYFDDDSVEPESGIKALEASLMNDSDPGNISLTMNESGDVFDEQGENVTGKILEGESLTISTDPEPQVAVEEDEVDGPPYWQTEEHLGDETETIEDDDGDDEVLDPPTEQPSSKGDFAQRLNEVLPFDDKAQLRLIALVTGDMFTDVSQVLPKRRGKVVSRINRAIKRLGGKSVDMHRIERFFRLCIEEQADLSTVRGMAKKEKEFTAQENKQKEDQ